jgi:SP family xylose:H+ symportor-like MFS transporter
MLFFEFGKPAVSLLLTFNAYRVLGGIGVGLASAICPMYIAEVSPANVRGRLVSVNQFAIIFGMLVVYFVNYVIRIHLPGNIEQAMMEIGWRRMFLSEAFPAATFGLLLLFVPKTPRYLVMSGNETKALNVLSRINGVAPARKILEEIKETVVEKREKLFSYGVTVVIIGILLSFFQQAVGINVVLYYAPRIFETWVPPVTFP